jgi:altronate dehydratase
MGYPVVPVIKIASNTRLFEAMDDDLDLDAQAALEGRTLSDAGDDIESLLERVLDGEETKAEMNRQDGIACLYTTFPSF